jgi:hypothetical protein
MYPTTPTTTMGGVSKIVTASTISFLFTSGMQMYALSSYNKTFEESYNIQNQNMRSSKPSTTISEATDTMQKSLFIKLLRFHARSQ